MTTNIFNILFFGFDVLCVAAIAVVFVRVLVPAYRNALNAIDGLTRGINTASFVAVETATLIKSSEVALTQIPKLLSNVDDSLEYLAEAKRRSLAKSGKGHQF